MYRDKGRCKWPKGTSKKERGVGLKVSERRGEAISKKEAISVCQWQCLNFKSPGEPLEELVHWKSDSRHDCIQVHSLSFVKFLTNTHYASSRRLLVIMSFVDLKFMLRRLQVWNDADLCL